jgi:hypothetical protein
VKAADPRARAVAIRNTCQQAIGQAGMEYIKLVSSVEEKANIPEVREVQHIGPLLSTRRFEKPPDFSVRRFKIEPME